MKFLINTKIGMNRGKKRLWLEGLRLIKTGFHAGDKISITGSDKLTIKHDSNADKIVSRRKKKDELVPIIEIVGDKLKCFNAGESVRVLITPKGIIITRTTKEKIKNQMLQRIIKRISQGLPLRTASLFHGGGVLDSAVHHGLKRSGVASKISLAIESEAKYINSSLLNNNELFDNESVVVESLIEQIHAFTDDFYDVALMGIPCTGASIAGKTKNKLECAEQHDTAGSMFYYALNFAVKSPIIIIENVVPYLKTMSFTVIKSVLEAQGYVVQTTILNGNKFGAIENRDRMCAVAMLSELAEYLDINDIVPDEQTITPCINDILEDVPKESPQWKQFQYLKDKEIRDLAAGKGFKRTLVSGCESSCGTIGRLYHKCRSTESYVQSPYDNELSRLFTPTEHAKLKTIPTKLITGQSNTTAHEILGQSIIYKAFIKVGQVIGKSIKNFTLANQSSIDLLVA